LIKQFLQQDFQTRNKIAKKEFRMSIKKIIIITIFFTSLLITQIQAQEIAVPIEVQYPLFLKILTFDRNFKNRVGDEIKLGIVFQSKFRGSNSIKDRFVQVMNEYLIKSVEGIQINQILIDINKVNLEGFIARNEVDILYITPVRAFGINQITRVSRKENVLTITGIPDYVESGIAVGIGMKGNKPRIIINLPASKNEGCDFSSQLLKLAKVIMK